MRALAYLAGIYLLGDRLIGKLTKLDTLAKRTMGRHWPSSWRASSPWCRSSEWLVTLLLTMFGFRAIRQASKRPPYGAGTFRATAAASGYRDDRASSVAVGLDRHSRNRECP